MADSTPPASSSSTSKGGSLGFLGRKIGPVPIWLIGLALIAAYYWYSNYGPGASSSSSSSADAVDPATNVPWAEELGEAQQQLADQQSQQPASPPTDTDTPAPGTPSGPPPVSRQNRSPQVKHQIHQIHSEHVAAEKKPAARTQARKTTATVAAKRTAAAPRKTGPARTTTRWRAPATTGKKAA